jgi:HSP20 family protein
MNLVRWTPFNEMSLLQNQMNRLFDSTLHAWPGDCIGTTSWVPAADIYETDDDLVVNIDLPGVDPKLVEVRVENNVLTIRGERQFDPKQNSESYHRVERSYGPFGRAFTLSTSVNPEKIRATYQSGILTIVLSKAESAKPRKIEVTAGAATAVGGR